MKKKSVRIMIISLLVLVLIGAGAYTAYNKAGDYLLQETIGKQMESGFTEAIGVDLSESGRVLTEEEVEKVEALLQAVEKVADASTKAEVPSESTEEAEGTVHTSYDESSTATNQPSSSKVHKDTQITTDQVKEKLQTQVTQVIKQIPSKDKNAMMNLVLSNLSMSDINYLASLATDGVSSSDIAEAKRIALNSFSKEEIEKVRDYYYAYSYLVP